MNNCYEQCKFDYLHIRCHCTLFNTFVLLSGTPICGRTHQICMTAVEAEMITQQKLYSWYKCVDSCSDLTFITSMSFTPLSNRSLSQSYLTGLPINETAVIIAYFPESDFRGYHRIASNALPEFLGELKKCIVVLLQFFRILPNRLNGIFFMVFCW